MDFDYTIEEIEEVLDMKEECYSVEEISYKTGISCMEVITILKIISYFRLV